MERLQFVELFGRDGQLRSKQLLAMAFELIEARRFDSMARDAGFRVLELYRSYDRCPFDGERGLLTVLAAP